MDAQFAPAPDPASTERGGNSEDSGHRRKLPKEISKSVTILNCESSANGGRCYVYLVGTSHVSQESCGEVQAVISYLKPEVVFLELCHQRVDVLTPQNVEVPTFAEMLEMWKKKHNLFGIIYSWYLAKAANQLEVYPGAEFRVAYEEAMKYGGKVVLGDRPAKITTRRTWDRMPLWQRTKLLYSFIFQSLFVSSPKYLNQMLKEMEDADVMTLMIQDMSKEFPTLMETLIDERDQYMSHGLLKIARRQSSVVAVVGKGHIRGIKKYWKKPVVVKDLLVTTPRRKSASVVKIAASFGVAAAGVAIVTGIYYFKYKK